MASMAKFIPAMASVASALMVTTPSHLRGGSVAPMVMHMYEQDCGRQVNRSSLIQGGTVPEEFKPYENVWKDGYYQVDCVKDYVLEHGDKYGDNKFSYNAVEVAGVSIIRYTDLIAKENREQMTHQVCFSFCRTLEGMTFFGLRNGRECYCSPFYKAEASDSSMCDAPCDGDATTMCGGKSKSSMFGMHHCGDMQSNVEGARDDLVILSNDVVNLIGRVSDLETGMKTVIDDYQTLLSSAGDSAASNTLQQGKAFLGDLDKVKGVANKVVEDMSPDKFVDEIQALTGADATSDAAVLADSLLADIRRSIVKHEDAMDALGTMMKVNLEVSSAATKDMSKQYYPAMYFVDKEFEESPSTCSGTPTGQPLYASKDQCSYVCNQDVHSCVGFSFYPKTNDDDGVCFFFSKLKTLTYYTGCGDNFKHPGTACHVKYAKFDGTSLKPDGSGKCDHCLKEANKAERCFGDNA